MRWGWVRQFPKWAVAAVLIIGSTSAFLVWKATYRMRHMFDGLNRPGPVEDLAPKIAKVEAHHDRMVLVDNDLYDVETGELVFKNWLSEGMPARVFFDSNRQRVVARYPNGFVRYALTGIAEAKLLDRSKPIFSDDFRWAAYVKEKDIWKADIDWNDLRFVNERRVTNMGTFVAQYFADNVFAGTDNTLLVRSQPHLLQVNLETGEVKPTRLPLLDIAKRRSPDSKSIVGFEKGEFYCYDLDSGDAKSIPVGRGSISDYQWFDNDRCAFIANGRGVALYDRVKLSVTEVCALPFPCSKIGEPSPSGRYVFCVGGRQVALVDVEGKHVTPLPAIAVGICWLTDSTFAFSRDAPDSALRGTWIQTVGEDAKRASTEPYLVGRNGPTVIGLGSGLVICATKHGLARMNRDRTEIQDVARLHKLPQTALGIEVWKY